MAKDVDELNVASLLRESELYESPTSEKQGDILRAAEKLFSTKGFDGTPTAAIAKEAGVTERTLFKHFPTKSCLLRRVLFGIIVKTFLPVQMRIVKRMLSHSYPTYADFFRTLARDRIATAEKNSHRMKIVLQEMLNNDRFRQQFSKMWVDTVWDDALGVLKRLRDEGKIHPDVDLKTLARMQVTILSGYTVLTQIFAADQKWDHEGDLEKMIEILAKGCVK